MLSQYVEQTCARELLADEHGGVGYLLEDRVADVSEFTDALRRVAEGGTAMDPEIVSQLLVRVGPLEQLTREREVLALMAEGRSNAGISESLQWARPHVSTSACRQMGVARGRPTG